MTVKSAHDIWVAALGQLQIQVSKPNYDTWLRDTEGISYEGNTFTINVPNAFVAEWLDNRLNSLIKKTLVSILGKAVEVHFTVKEQPDMHAVSTSMADGGTSSKLLSKPVITCRLTPRYNFSTFVTGEANRLAYAVALEVAENPGQVYNPLLF